jgi:hypothetical protein
MQETVLTLTRTPMDTPPRSRDEIVASTRAALLDFGRATHAFERRVCRCDDPACIYREPAVFPLHLLLQETSRVLRQDRTRQAPDLRQALIALGQAFRLFECDCDEPDCPAVTAPAESTADLASTVFVQWYSLGGTLGRDDPDSMGNGAETAIRNLHTVSAWTERLHSAGLADIRTAVRAFVSSDLAAWRREAKILATECVEHWIPRPTEQPEVYDAAGGRGALSSVLLVAEAGGWRPDEAAAWLLLANEALLALLTRDLVDPEVTAALYAPMEDLIPLDALRLDVLAGTTGTPPGFFRA